MSSSDPSLTAWPLPSSANSPNRTKMRIEACTVNMLKADVGGEPKVTYDGHSTEVHTIKYDPLISATVGELSDDAGNPRMLTLSMNLGQHPGPAVGVGSISAVIDSKGHVAFNKESLEVRSTPSDASFEKEVGKKVTGVAGDIESCANSSSSQVSIKGPGL